MKKRVLSIGQCYPDQNAIRSFLQTKFDAQVDDADVLSDSMEKMQSNSYDLVLINRKLDRDYTDGVNILQAIKKDEQLKSLPVMIITNFPEHQEIAISHGAVQGFGKKEFHLPETLERLIPYLGESQ